MGDNACCAGSPKELRCQPFPGIGLREAEDEEVSGHADVGGARAASRLAGARQGGCTQIEDAQILLKADEADGGPGWREERIATTLEVGTATVERVRRRFVSEGLEAALRPCRIGTRIYQRKLDGARAGGASHRGGLFAAAGRARARALAGP
jgi:hypothetical protein